jgi:hypothetical protein
VRALKRLGLAIVVLAVAAGWNANRAADDDSQAVIIAAMRRVFTGQDPPLVYKAAAGQAGETEKKRLLTVLTGLAKTQVDHGDADAWKARTAALVEAAQDIVDGKDGAGVRLRQAADCKACHQAHRAKGA